MGSKEKVLVQFENVQERYFIDDNKPIKIEYVLNVEYEPSTKDWLGIFPKGWRDLEQQLYADFAVSKYSGSNKYRRSFEFDLRNLSAKMNCFNADYQIVYVSKGLQVLGRSSYFRLQKQYGDVHSYGDGLYEGTGMGKVDPRTTNCANNPSTTRAIVPVSKTKSCLDKIGAAVATATVAASWPMNGALPITQGINHGIGGTGFPLVRPYRSECVLPVSTQNRDYGAPRCKFCLRTNELLKQKQSLYSQLKDLAELNNDQKNRIVELEKKLEMNMVAQKRLKLLCHHIRLEKRSYEMFVSELFSNLRTNSPVCVSDKGYEMMVHRVNADIENHLVQLTMRHSPQNERYLKAVIGNQELKIQELSARLAELELQGRKPKIDQKEIEKKKKRSNTSLEKLEKKNKLNEIKYVPVVQKSAIDVRSSQDDRESTIPHPIEAVVEIRNSSEKMQAVIFDVNNNDYDKKENKLQKVEENELCKNVSSESFENEEVERCENIETSECATEVKPENVDIECIDFDLIEIDSSQSTINDNDDSDIESAINSSRNG